MRTPAAMSARRFAAMICVCRTLSNRPVIVMIGISRNSHGGVTGTAQAARRRLCGGGYHMTMPHDDLIDRPRAAIFRRELTLLDRAFDVQVLALVEGDGDVGEIAVKRQAVPVCVFVPLLVAVLIPIALPKADVSDGCS